MMYVAFGGQGPRSGPPLAHAVSTSPTASISWRQETDKLKRFTEYSCFSMNPFFMTSQNIW